MMETTHTETHEQTVKGQWWIRSKEPTLPFLFWGLLPLLGLLFVFGWGVTRFAQSTIQSTVKSKIVSDLRDQKMPWVNVAVDGQQVHLSGMLPSAGENGDSAIALAKKSACHTFAGELTCAISVDGKFEAPVAKPVDQPMWPNVRAKLSGDSLFIVGEAPNEETRKQLIADCEALKNPPKIATVSCEFILTRAPAPAAFGALSKKVLNTISQCEQGNSSVVSGVFSASCDVKKEAFASIDASARTVVEGGQLGNVSLLVKEDIEACEKGLLDLLAKSQIQFAVARADIVPAAKPLLDKIAAIAKNCPGSLRIEGHTDSVGAIEMNTTLSQARADAVRDALVTRGIEKARLLSQGFGPTKPIAPNETPIGRAKNRRIEFHVERPSGETP
jgi:outer membrane protein OmpA-like peptidoglycan-associated protein